MTCGNADHGPFALSVASAMHRSARSTAANEAPRAGPDRGPSQAVLTAQRVSLTTSRSPSGDRPGHWRLPTAVGSLARGPAELGSWLEQGGAFKATDGSAVDETQFDAPSETSHLQSDHVTTGPVLALRCVSGEFLLTCIDVAGGDYDELRSFSSFRQNFSAAYSSSRPSCRGTIRSATSSRSEKRACMDS